MLIKQIRLNTTMRSSVLVDRWTPPVSIAMAGFPAPVSIAMAGSSAPSVAAISTASSVGVVSPSVVAMPKAPLLNVAILDALLHSVGILKSASNMADPNASSVARASEASSVARAVPTASSVARAVPTPPVEIVDLTLDDDDDDTCTTSPSVIIDMTNESDLEEPIVRPKLKRKRLEVIVEIPIVSSKAPVYMPKKKRRTDANPEGTATKRRSLEQWKLASASRMGLQSLGAEYRAK